MFEARSRRPSRIVVAVLVMLFAVAGGFAAATDFHGEPPSDGPAWAPQAEGAGLDGLACSACLLRAQLEGSDLALTGGLGAVSAGPESLSSFGCPTLTLLIGPALPARGPPASPLLPA